TPVGAEQRSCKERLLAAPAAYLLLGETREDPVQGLLQSLDEPVDSLPRVGACINQPSARLVARPVRNLKQPLAAFFHSCGGFVPVLEGPQMRSHFPLSSLCFVVARQQPGITIQLANVTADDENVSCHERLPPISGPCGPGRTGRRCAPARRCGRPPRPSSR